ncbi:MAG: periplasmic heavy metal sensor [Boseongicola sp.]|nr:periplasmic heavy metal sensor [Boseongicola sp.]MYH59249.1 periplasmic heavy metal sensor [Boseongicola sp. SB0675_bin_26]
MNENATSRRRRSWVKPLLFVSLALNLVVIGAFVGRALAPDRPRWGDGVAGPVRGVIGEPFAHALGPGDRGALHDKLTGKRPHLQASRGRLRDLLDELLVALRAEPFQPDEVRRILQEQRGVAEERQLLGQTLLLERLEAMSPEERSAYADRLERSLKRFRRR